MLLMIIITKNHNTPGNTTCCGLGAAQTQEAPLIDQYLTNSDKKRHIVTQIVRGVAKMVSLQISTAGVTVPSPATENIVVRLGVPPICQAMPSQFWGPLKRRSYQHSAPELNGRTGLKDSLGRKATAPTKAHLASIRWLHMQDDRDHTQSLIG
jgi:hypothetical protein